MPFEHAREGDRSTTAADGSGPPDGSPGRWLVLHVEAPPRGQEVYLAEALRRVGARGLRREGMGYVAYVPPPVRPDDVLRHATGAIRAATSLSAPRVRWEWCSRKDMETTWARLDGVIQAGDTLLLTGPTDRVPLPPGKLVLRLKPGPAFGDGSHPTTRSSLRILERLVEPRHRVADVGTGTGVLAIAAALLGAGEVVAFEADPLAAGLAVENVRINRVADRVSIRHLEAGSDELARSGPLDGVAANLEPGLLVPLAPGLRTALEARRGWLLASGIPRIDCTAVVQSLGRSGFQLHHQETYRGWWSGTFRTAGGTDER